MDNVVIQNNVCIDDSIMKYNGYCVVNYDTNEIITAKTLKELATKTGLVWATLQRNVKKIVK